MTKYSIKRRTKKYVKRYGFLSFAITFSNKYKKGLLDTGLNALKTSPKKIVHKAAEATSEFIGHNVADKIVKPKHVIDENLQNVEEIIISPEKKRRNIKRILNYSIIKL